MSNAVDTSSVKSHRTRGPPTYDKYVLQVTSDTVVREYATNACRQLDRAVDSAVDSAVTVDSAVDSAVTVDICQVRATVNKTYTLFA